MFYICLMIWVNLFRWRLVVTSQTPQVEKIQKRQIGTFVEESSGRASSRRAEPRGRMARGQRESTDWFDRHRTQRVRVHARPGEWRICHGRTARTSRTTRDVRAAHCYTRQRRQEYRAQVRVRKVFERESTRSRDWTIRSHRIKWILRGRLLFFSLISLQIELK